MRSSKGNPVPTDSAARDPLPTGLPVGENDSTLQKASDISTGDDGESGSSMSAGSGGFTSKGEKSGLSAGGSG